MGNTSRQRVQAMLNVGYRLTLNDKLTLRPAAMLKIPFAGPVAIDLNLNLDIKNQFNVGVGFRNQDALIFLAGFKINEQFSLNYSFDYTVSGLRNVSSNTHEISIGFITCKPDKKGYANCALFE